MIVDSGRYIYHLPRLNVMAEFCFDRARCWQQHVPSIRSHVKSRETCARAPLHPEGITGVCVYPSSHRIRFSFFFFLFPLDWTLVLHHFDTLGKIGLYAHNRIYYLCAVFISIQAILQGTWIKFKYKEMKRNSGTNGRTINTDDDDGQGYIDAYIPVCCVPVMQL